MEKNKYILQFSEDFKKIYEREPKRLPCVWSLYEDASKAILNTVPTRNGDDYVYEFETAHRVGFPLTCISNKITINGKIVKNRYGHTDYDLSDEEWAKIREHSKRNMEVFNGLIK